MKTKILVTGGAGFIGSHTTVELINEGFDVISVDNLSNSTVDAINGIQQITGAQPTFRKIDCNSKADMLHLFQEFPDIQGIIHFAAYKAVGESVQQPLKYYKNNINSLLNLLEIMPQFEVKGIVFSSSCTVYGQPDILPVTENAPIKPAESPYGNTKQICEEIIKDNAKADARFQSILLRYFNSIGAHPTAIIGELPIGTPQNLVPLLTQTAAGLRPHLNVYGNDYHTPDGSCIRDYINVVDLAQAHVTAVNRLLNNKQTDNVEVFNLGTGNGVSVLELINTFQHVTGVNVPHKIVGRREGDIEKVWADPTHANNVLGWKATTSLENTLLSAWNWQKKLSGM